MDEELTLQITSAFKLFTVTNLLTNSVDNTTTLFYSLTDATPVSLETYLVIHIDRQSAPQTVEKENIDRIPFTITFHPHNNAVKSSILKNFKLLQSNSETGTIFSQPPLISFKRGIKIGNFLVRSSFQTNDQPSTFIYARSRCKT